MHIKVLGCQDLSKELLIYPGEKEKFNYAKRLTYFYFTHMSVFPFMYDQAPCICLVPTEAEKVVGFFRTRLTHGCSLSHGC